MVDAWMPGARCLRAQADGGTLRGGAPRVVWQALGADPRLISATSAAERLAQEGRPPHLVWNPVSGDIVQLIPLVRAACSLGNPEGLDYQTGGFEADGYELGGYELGGYELDRAGAAAGAGARAANRQGRLCAQIGVVAWAWEPFTDGPMHGAGALLSWLTSWGIPSRWPAGRPAPFMHAQTPSARCSSARWALGGHFGASQVPGWDAAGPGDIDINLLSTPATVPCVAPCVAIDGVRPSRPLRAVPTGRSETVTHARRVALADMLGPEVDAGPAPAAARFAGQRA